MANETEVPRDGQTVLVIVCWLAVGLPLAWGIWQTIKKALLLVS
jgi:hypothetical protein